MLIAVLCNLYHGRSKNAEEVGATSSVVSIQYWVSEQKWVWQRSIWSRLCPAAISRRCSLRIDDDDDYDDCDVYKHLYTGLDVMWELIRLHFACEARSKIFRQYAPRPLEMRDIVSSRIEYVRFIKCRFYELLIRSREGCVLSVRLFVYVW